MRLFIIIILSLLLAENLQSQSFLQNFKASEGLPKAQTAASDANLPNPELIMVFTANQTFNYQGTEIKITFDITKGTANAWIYVYRSRDNHQLLKVFGVYKVILLGFMSTEVDPSQIIGTGLPVNPEGVIPGGWKDSDAAAAVFRNDQDFMTFYNAHTNPELFVFTLFVNDAYNYIPKNQLYWGMSIIDKGNEKSCATHAFNLDFTCGTIFSVDESNTEITALELYPNPAHDNIMITGFSGKCLITKLEILNLSGEKVKELLPDNSSTGIINADIKVLESGTYILRIFTGRSPILKLFQVVR